MFDRLFGINNYSLVYIERDPVNVIKSQMNLTWGWKTRLEEFRNLSNIERIIFYINRYKSSFNSRYDSLIREYKIFTIEELSLDDTLFLELCNYCGINVFNPSREDYKHGTVDLKKGKEITDYFSQLELDELDFLKENLRVERIFLGYISS